MIGLPYLCSPIWKYGVSSVASMKLPSGDVEQARHFRADLPAENERGVEAAAVGFERGAVDAAHVADGIAYEPRRAIERGHREQAFRLRRDLLDQLFVEETDDGLRDRQVSSRCQHDDALADLAPVVQLAEHGDVVVAGAGARIGGKHEPAVEPQRHAIGHAGLLLVTGVRPLASSLAKFAHAIARGLTPWSPSLLRTLLLHVD